MTDVRKRLTDHMLVYRVQTIATQPIAYRAYVTSYGASPSAFVRTLAERGFERDPRALQEINATAYRVTDETVDRFIEMLDAWITACRVESL